MTMTKTILLSFFTILTCIKAAAQQPAKDTADLMSQLENEAAPKTEYTKATFKTTRLVNGHSVETLAKGVMDVKISHRFGKLNNGIYEMFGLDNATMRMGLDYGITDNIMVGLGRSTFQKTLDAFVKIKLLRQSAGAKNSPFSIVYIPTIALVTLRTQPKLPIKHKLYYAHQLIIGRKFSDAFSMQLMPTVIHRNLTAVNSDPNDTWAIGIGGRQKLSKRVSFNAEYYYQLPGTKIAGSTNSLSFGFDIETGGHVFQLHFTNSTGMTEKTFVSETTGKWDKGDILFGFNIARVFNIGKRK
ncbi:MAG: DUF5777 family beta-barrel protein [Ferruginibacter sp.]